MSKRVVDRATDEYQDMINASPDPRRWIEATLLELARKYPQYAGTHADMVLGRVRRSVRSKFGVAFKRGDIVLYKPVPETLGMQGEHYSIWGVRNDIHSLLPVDWVEPYATEMNG